MYLIRLLNLEQTFHCSVDKTLLQGMQSVSKRGIPIGCRGGGCGICRVRVLRGHYHCQKMSQGHVNEQEQADGLALACRLYPESDLDVEVLGLKNCKKPLQII